MEFGFIVQLALFGGLALLGLVIIVGMLKAIPRPHKVKAYRNSRVGDGWLLGSKSRP